MAPPSSLISTLFVFALTTLAIQAAPTAAKNKNQREPQDILRRQLPAGFRETCGLCSSVERLSPYLTPAIETQELKQLIRNIVPTQPNLLKGLFLEALASLNIWVPITSDTPSGGGNPLPGGIPSLVQSRVPEINPITIPSVIPNHGGRPEGLASGLSNLASVLPTILLPTKQPDLENTPKDLAPIIPYLVPTGLPIIGNLPAELASGLSNLASILPVGRPTELPELNDIPRQVNSILPGAIPTGLPINLDSALPNPTGLPNIQNLPGALEGIIPSDLASNVLKLFPGGPGGEAGFAVGFPNLLPQAISNALESGLPGIAPIIQSKTVPTKLINTPVVTDLANGLSIPPVLPPLPSDPVNGLPNAIPSLLAALLPAVPVLGALPSVMPAPVTELPPVPINSIGALPSISLLSGLPPVAVQTNIVGGLVPTPAMLGSGPGDLPGLIAGSLPGLLDPTNAALPPTIPGSGLSGQFNLNNAATPPTPTAAKSARVISSGSIPDRVYNWTFYSTGAVQVNNAFISLNSGALSGFLNDRTFAGLFADGLHIGKYVVPYPPAYLPLLNAIKLPIAPQSLASIDPDGYDSR